MEDTNTKNERLSLRGTRTSSKLGASKFSAKANKGQRSFNRVKDRQKCMVNAFVQGKGQNAALKWLMDSRVPVSVFLTTGVKFEGLISAFDAFTIKISDVKRHQQLIYKDKISTITIKKPDAASNQGKRPFNQQGHFVGENGMTRPLAGDADAGHDDGVTLPTKHVEYQG